MNMNRITTLEIDPGRQKPLSMLVERNGLADARIPNLSERSTHSGESRLINKKTILVPIDFTTVSRQGVEIALGLAKKLDASVVLVHVVSRSYAAGFIDSSPKNLGNKARRLAQRKLKILAFSYRSFAIPIRTIVRGGMPEFEILKLAEQMKPEMIVMVRQNRNPISRWIFGSITRDILDEANCPVLVINRSSKPSRFVPKRTLNRN